MPRQMNTSVDDHVNSTVLPEHRDTVAMLRALVHGCAPDAEELVRYGMPVFKPRRIFAWISPSRQAISFGFACGAGFEDKYDLLRGTGKGSKHIKLKTAGSVDRDVLRYYIRQAVALDAT